MGGSKGTGHHLADPVSWETYPNGTEVCRDPPEIPQEVAGEGGPSSVLLLDG